MAKNIFGFHNNSVLLLLDRSGVEQGWQMETLIPFASCVSHVSSHL